MQHSKFWRRYALCSCVNFGQQGDSQNRVQATEASGTATQFSFLKSCSFRNMSMLGKASSLLCSLFLQKCFCHGSFIQTSVPFPCVRHGSISLLPRKVPAPQKAVSSGSSLCCCMPCVCPSRALSPALLTMQPRDTSCTSALALLTGALAGQWTPASILS